MLIFVSLSDRSFIDLIQEKGVAIYHVPVPSFYEVKWKTSKTCGTISKLYFSRHVRRPLRFLGSDDLFQLLLLRVLKMGHETKQVANVPCS